MKCSYGGFVYFQYFIQFVRLKVCQFQVFKFNRLSDFGRDSIYKEGLVRFGSVFYRVQRLSSIFKGLVLGQVKIQFVQEFDFFLENSED